MIRSTAAPGAIPITFGQPLRSVGVADLVVTETRHGAGRRLRSHEHEVASLYLPLCGTLRETIERRAFDLEPGTALVKPGGARHSNVYGPLAVVGIVIEVPAAAQGRLSLAALFADRRRFVDPGLPRAAQELARALRLPEAGRARLVEELLHALFGRLRRAPTSEGGRPAWLALLRSRVLEEPDLGASLEDLAASVGRHPSHVAREFRRAYGTTLGGLVRRRRIEQAAAALRRSSPTSAFSGLGRVKNEGSVLVSY